MQIKLGVDSIPSDKNVLSGTGRSPISQKILCPELGRKQEVREPFLCLLFLNCLQLNRYAKM